MLAYTTSIQLRIGILPEKLGKKNQSKTKENKQTNKKTIQIGKEEEKLSLFTDGMICNDPKISTVYKMKTNPVSAKNEVSKAEGDQINTKRQLYL
jgi:hypothetical protein